MPRKDYEERQKARRERLEEGAERAEQESARRFQGARDSVAGIPPGQPILVGHHSEGRHGAALRRHDQNMRKGVEAGKKASERPPARAAGAPLIEPEPCRHCGERYECDDACPTWLEDWERELGGTFDGSGVVSDADGGL